ncbi:hypothetical protein BDQ17DRAFT_1329659 [Cyathus striatus]|nr:hypothetical protein BDQ17DRAFT_1329659 [Cyathus striatus]
MASQHPGPPPQDPEEQKDTVDIDSFADYEDIHRENDSENRDTSESNMSDDEYKNHNDGGFTCTSDLGEAIPLTPSMMLQWCRAIYDGKMTIKLPQNTLAFDPQTQK